MHFDLDPGPGAEWPQVLECGRIVRDALDALEMPSLVKTTGSRGLHVYVPIVRGPVQKDVWTFAKALAVELAARNPKLMTSEYKVAKRPHGRVLVDYNQNAWGRTLASIYSVRPRPQRTRLDAGDVAGDRQGLSDRGLPARQRAPAHREGGRPVETAASGARPGGSPPVSGRRRDPANGTVMSPSPASRLPFQICAASGVSRKAVWGIP